LNDELLTDNSGAVKPMFHRLQTTRIADSVVI